MYFIYTWTYIRVDNERDVMEKMND